MIWLWLGFGALVLALLALDLGVFNRNPHRIELREAIWWSVLWVSVGLAFTVPVYFIYQYHWFGLAKPPAEPREIAGGLDAVLTYLTGFLLEKSLSVDNIFVIAVIFTHFKVAAMYQHRVLYWGILGAIVFRALMIFGGVWLLERFEWLFYVFGAYLIYAGIKMLRDKEETVDPDRSLSVSTIRRLVTINTDDHGGKFLTRSGGRLAFTRLFLVLVVIEFTDVVFAVDSVPAVLAITTDSFLVLTSNVFAILGLRSIYFVLAEMIRKFHYLKHSLCVILVFIGAKMVLRDMYEVPTASSLLVILVVFTAGVVASLRRNRPRIASRS